MPPVESEAMPDKEGPVAREEDVLELLLALERRFNRLSGNVKAYNEKIADLISDVEMLKAGAESSGVHDDSIPTSIPSRWPRSRQVPQV